MSLVTEMLNRSVGEHTLTAALFDGNTEISPRGYRPIPIRNWEVRGTSASFLVTFGPYDDPYEYDRYVIFDGDEVVQMIPEESRVSFPRGFSFDWHFELELTDKTAPESRTE